MSIKVDIKCPICGNVFNVGFVMHMITVHGYEPSVARELYLRTVRAEMNYALEMFGGDASAKPCV
jgi:hypothetical protein